VDVCDPSLCVDSGATHSVTNDRSLLSDYRAFPPGSGQVSLATEGQTGRAEGQGTLTVKLTGRIIVLRGTVYMPSARRTLLCLGKELKSGVTWTFDTPTGGHLTVRGQGFWGDLSLGLNDLIY
jgi:hypothetical protein